MSDVGIIGSKDLVGLFKLLGVEVHPAENVNDAKRLLAEIVSKRSLKVVFVLESLATHMRAELRLAQETDGLTVVPLPDRMSEVSYLDDELKRLSKEAIGMEV